MANHATNELELRIVVITDRSEDDKYVVEGQEKETHEKSRDFFCYVRSQKFGIVN